MTPFYHEGLTLLLDFGHFLPYRKCDLGHTISPGRTSKGGDQRLTARSSQRGNIPPVEQPK